MKKKLIRSIFLNIPNPSRLGSSTRLTLAQVGVFHVHSPTHRHSDLTPEAPEPRTQPRHILSVQTQWYSQFYTTSSTALTRRKKDNAIYRSFF